MINLESVAVSNEIAPSNRVALLLAGGDGTRLHELTREIAGIPIPKQYCPLLNNSSLLQATLARAQLFAPRDRISVIVNQNHLDLALEQLTGIPGGNVFV
jgi:mannose-1-phosphate guanylyltransferase